MASAVRMKNTTSAQSAHISRLVLESDSSVSVKYMITATTKDAPKENFNEPYKRRICSRLICDSSCSCSVMPFLNKSIM